MAKKPNENNLIGMDAISVYLNGLSHTTILKWYRDYDLPIKNNGGTWTASAPKIDKWFETPAGQAVVPETSNQRAAKAKIEDRQKKR